MIFLRRISNSIRAIFSSGLTPLNRVKTQITRLRTNNIFTQAGQRLRLVQSRLNHYTKLPGRYLGISNKGGTASADDNNNSKNHEHESITDFHGRELGTNAQQLHQRLHRKQTHSGISTVQHIQIHLFDRMSGEYDILHLGSSSGRTKAKHVVNGETLIFAQAAPEISKSDHTILVSALSSGVKVNGQALDGTVVLPHGSEINIKGRRYRVDLQLSERLSAPAQIQAVWETDIGPARRENQDAIGIYHGDNNVYLFAVADGVGSGYSGDKMSAYTINYLLSAINLNHHKAIPWEEVLYQAIHNANTEIRNFLLNLQQHGGTTLTALVIEEWTATISHLGDSRLYLLRNKMLKQISQDHSEEIASDDISTLDKVETQFVLSKAIGKTNQVEPDLMTLKLQPDDRLLLCTDGITGRIADDELSQLLSDAPIINLARQLVQLSNQRNNTDNASAIVIDILDHQTRDMTWETKAQPRVYIGDSTHMIELKKIEKSAANKQVREETSSDDDENGLGCSCLVLSFLIGCLILAILWGSGFLYESLGLDVLSQNQVQESSQTPEIANTVTLIPRPTRNASEILTSPTVAALLTTEALSSSPSALTEQETVTVIPTSTGSEQISFEIVSATALMQLEITSTVRPINPPR